MKEDEETDDLQRYRDSGHFVAEGKVGPNAVTVVITPYAEKRMKERDIDCSDVLAALASSPSSHGRGKSPGRFEVLGKTLRGPLRVIYERRTARVVLVITTYPESD